MVVVELLTTCYVGRWRHLRVNRRLFGSHTHFRRTTKTQRSSLNAGFSALSKVPVKEGRRGARQGESGGGDVGE